VTQPQSNCGFTLLLKILADPRRLRQAIKKLPVMEEELGGRKRRADGLLPEVHLCQLLTTGGRSSLRTRLKSRHASLDTLYHPASRPPQQWSDDETARMLEATNPLQHEVRGREVLESLDPNYSLRSCVCISIDIDQRIIVSSPCLVYLLNTHLTLC
jgi:hypothetical protein